MIKLDYCETFCRIDSIKFINKLKNWKIVILGFSINWTPLNQVSDWELPIWNTPPSSPTNSLDFYCCINPV